MRMGLHMQEYVQYSRMSERIQRHAILRRLVDERAVESQQEFLDELAAAGLEVHQSTLSRDLGELGIRKRDGRYRMPAAPTLEPAAQPAASESLPDIPARPLVLGFTECGPNLITVQVGTGQAQMLGVLLDNSDEAPIAGTIAGDDTVLVVTKGRPEQRAAVNLLERWFGAERHVAS